MKNFPFLDWCLTLFLGFCVVGVPSCDESLPSHEVPPSLFQTDVYETRYWLVPANISTPSKNYISIKYLVKNIYDETLQGPTRFNGVIEIILMRNPSVRKVDSLSVANLTLALDYNNGILTLDPDGSVYFEYTWDPLIPSDSLLRAMMFRYITDPNCGLRQISFRESFLIQGEVSMFDHTAPVRFGPKEFSFCHVTAAIDTATCPAPQCPNE